jgi:hypothetical protein
MKRKEIAAETGTPVELFRGILSAFSAGKP